MIVFKNDRYSFSKSSKRNEKRSFTKTINNPNLGVHFLLQFNVFSVYFAVNMQVFKVYDIIKKNVYRSISRNA